MPELRRRLRSEKVQRSMILSLVFVFWGGISLGWAVGRISR